MVKEESTLMLELAYILLNVLREASSTVVYESGSRPIVGDGHDFREYIRSEWRSTNGCTSDLCRCILQLPSFVTQHLDSQLGALSTIVIYALCIREIHIA